MTNTEKHGDRNNLAKVKKRLMKLEKNESKRSGITFKANIM